jgi:hypothetical protein
METNEVSYNQETTHLTLNIYGSGDHTPRGCPEHPDGRGQLHPDRRPRGRVLPLAQGQEEQEETGDFISASFAFRPFGRQTFDRWTFS